MRPEVSIVIPTFNRGNLISQTLTSISHQTLGNWEVIVVDDGSTDNAVSVIESWVQSDDRIHYIQRQTLPTGACACRNLGTASTQGRYVIYLDSDDLLATTSLENRVAEMDANPDLDFGIFSGVLFKNRPDDLKIVFNLESTSIDLDRFLSLDVPWQTTGPIWRKSSLDYYDLEWNENLLSWQDVEFHVHALALNLNYKNFPIQDFYYRVMQNFSIQTDIITSHHLRSRWGDCLSAIHSHLVSNSCDTPEREELIISLYFNWMDQWLGDF
jgi:glycosyltransferase involved in cell wall biosynthesis